MISLLLVLIILSGLFALTLRDHFYYFSVVSSLIIFGYTFFISFYSATQPLELGLLILKVDNISSLFILLTSFLTAVCVINSKNHANVYVSLFFLLEAIIICLFLATDLLTFFVFFEFSLVPLFFIIGIWGGDNRVYAAYKFFLYTLAGSVTFLIAILFIYTETHTLSFHNLELLLPKFKFSTQKLLWIGMFLAFAVKIPMFPFHTWLPDAHVQAPTNGSIMLAGVLIKLGAYGFIRILIPMLPDACHHFSPLVFMLSAIAVVYTSIIAIMQTDMKKLVAYSSIAHMGVVTAGLFSMKEEGISGAIFHMISHGLISGALFLCVGILYSRTHTREINSYTGLANEMPIFSFAFIMFSMASIGLPGTSGFIGEFLSILGVFQKSQIFAMFCLSGVILSACYMLYLCKRIIYGAECSIQVSGIKTFEVTSMFMLLVSIVTLGLFPNPIFALISN